MLASLTNGRARCLNRQNLKSLAVISGVSLTRDESKASYAIIRHNIRTYESGGVVLVIKGKENADPGSVIFDAIRKAREDGFDLVIADTAGRLHTKIPLMDELKKVERTCSRALADRAPDEVLLVLDSTTGQNAVQQAHMFREALRVTGIVLTKLDGTAKGGVIMGVVQQHGIPVRYVGLGERVEDLREFDAVDFVEALFSRPDGETLAA